MTGNPKPDATGDIAGRADFGLSEGATSGTIDFDSTDQLFEYLPETSPRYTWRPDGTGTTDYSPEPAAYEVSENTRPVRRGGAHRLPAPPAALKGRAAVVAVAAGAVVAAGQAALSNAATDAPTSNTASDVASTAGITAMPQAAGFLGTSDGTQLASTSASDAPQVLEVASPVDTTQFTTMLARGAEFAEQKAAREAAARRPMFALPAVGTFTSGFGSRWGTLHAGVDIANAIGTPILAVADGEVIDAGPASGFGMWVRLKHADGTVTIYGHIDSATVTVGQRVMAGDEIAKMGNRGYSTGPHCHFEVWLNGSDKVDPLPWLASRGISLGVERD
ncbi:M23 family metallopeptidase [Antrihabitans sp. YC2-6]|uniref:M23 family metallopeptidase n=1 Tax=Antrihabitans sp. YC2-6 TaxID=2799498 RepID=UPI0027DC4087|nr:M23 family metallopeptidase [Antrihabitans sp. YC2-6]